VNLDDQGRTRSVSVEGDSVTVDEHTFRAQKLGDGRVRLLDPDGAHVAWVTAEGRRVFVTLEGRDYLFETGAAGPRRPHAHDAASGEVTMPMPGLVIAVSVTEGERVKLGQTLVIVEAMKMEHTLRAPRDGVVRRLEAGPDKRFEGGAFLLEVQAS
jgi:acetyl/propionyl-CoA carboxylase alpha subunit